MADLKPVKLTASDRAILESYQTLLEGLAEYLGNGYEIVLHSLESFEHSVVKIVHGEHTGRKEGDPITDLALDMLEKIQSNDHLNHICYFTKNRNGHPLKSATIAIRGENGFPIGLLCINMYLDTPLSSILAALEPSTQLEETFAQGALDGDPSTVIRTETTRAVKAVEGNPKVMPSLRNREIVTLLEERGVFSLKDSVVIVAECLGVSKNTIYMHLRNIRAVNQAG